MDPLLTHAEPNTLYWSPLSKNAFRFFFLFFGLLSLFCYNVILEMLNIGSRNAGQIYRPLIYPLTWIDRHFFHIGLDAVHHLPLFTDGHFGWVALPVLLMASLFGTVIWALADRKPRGYQRLSY